MSGANIVAKEQMIISIEELKEQGLTLYKINQLVEQGVLRKLNKKFYENTDYQGEESDSLCGANEMWRCYEKLFGGVSVMNAESVKARLKNLAVK